MSIAVATTIVWALAAYAAIGAVFGLAFVLRAASRIDPAAEGMPWSARALILPGVAALWPLMLCKWLRQNEPPLA